MVSEPQVDWEDKYRRLKVKYEEKKIENVRQEDTLKK
jgi:hypothetical protein